MTHTTNIAVLPVWFRTAIIASVMLALCSCQAPLSSSIEQIEDLQLASSGEEPKLAVCLVANDEANETVQLQQPALVAGPQTDTTSEQPALPAPPREASLPRALTPVAFNEPEDSPSDTVLPRVAQACPPAGCDATCEQAACNSGGCDSQSCETESCNPETCNTETCTGGTCLGGCSQGASCPVGSPCGCAGCAVRGPLDEYLCDGGDCGQEVGVRQDWTIEGLNQEDTVAHYDTVGGCVLVVPSNRVCIYAPRFAAVRRVVNASESLQRELINVLEDDMVLGVADARDEPATSLQQLPPVVGIGQDPASLLINRQQAGELEGRIVVREIKDLIKPYCNLQVVKLGIHDNAEKPWLAKATLSALTWTGDQAPQVTIEAKAASVLVGSVAPGVAYCTAGGKPCLRLIKLASCDHAQPGDEIGFTLRFDNIGTQEIGNVTIVDNLSTRLAYVPDSAEASVEADFSTTENSSGSLILRWEIKEPVKAGEGGVLQFRVKVL